MPDLTCSQPVQLRGRVDYLDRTTGELLHRYATSSEPGGVLHIPCKTRRASRCPSCAETYRVDTYHLIRAGLTGGKGVPMTVAVHPASFVTLTAPSFGPVHTRREHDGRVVPCRPRRNGGTCPHGRPVGCSERHSPDDPRVGEPICPDCYDYTGSVLFNAHAPELWRRFTITLRRCLARLAGMTQKDLAKHVRISFAKVAEYQRRGVVHFHAVIRLDGPEGPDTLPPRWASADLLADAVRAAVPIVQVATPDAGTVPSRDLPLGQPARHPTHHHHGRTDRQRRRRIRRQVRHQSRRMYRDTRPPHHHRRCRRPAPGHRPRPAAHRRMPRPRPAPRIRAPAAHPLGAHARLPRPLLHEKPPLLHHPRRTTRRPHRLPGRTTRPRPHRRPGHCARPRPLAIHRPGPRRAGSATRHRAEAGCDMTKLLLTVSEAAESLGISRSKLYQLISAGIIRSVRIDGSRRVPVDALTAYINQLMEEAA